MLINDFFSLKEVKQSNHTIDAVVSFDENHSIFDGHFEGFPVVPGVCMMQLIKEIMEQVLHRSFRLSKASSMKFMTVIDPRQNSEVRANIEYGINGEDTVDFEAKLYSGETTFFKLKAHLV